MNDDFTEVLTAGSRYVRPLRLARILRGLSQSDVEDAAGLPPTVLSKLETGTRTADPATRERLAMALDVPAAVLFPRS